MGTFFTRSLTALFLMMTGGVFMISPRIGQATQEQDWSKQVIQYERLITEDGRWQYAPVARPEVFPQDGANQPVAPRPAQEQKAGDWDAVKIYDYYKDCVLDVQTTIELETPLPFSGEKTLTFGGSAFFLDKDGNAGTVAHVVKSKDDVLEFGGFFGPGQKIRIIKYEYSVVMTSKNRKYKAELVGVNVYSDTALIKVLEIDPADYNAARIGDSDAVKVGEPVYAIGMPLGLSNTLTAGKVSSVHRTIDFNYLEDFIQTDCPINPGNSGSPLIGSRGEVIAINDAAVRGAMGLGFSVATKLFRLDQLKKGELVMPWFGAEALVRNPVRMGSETKPRFQDMKEFYDKTGLDDPETLIMLAKMTYRDRWAVVSTLDETRTSDGKIAPAKRVGIRRGDLITKVNGKDVRTGMDVRMALTEIAIGKEFEVELVRVEKGVANKVTCKITAEKKPADGLQERGGNRRR